MRILFVCENYYPHRGGAEVLFKNLAEGYVQRGHQVTVLTHHLQGTKKIETINGVKIERVLSLHSRYMFTFFSVWRAIALARTHDLVQTTTFNGAPPAWLASRLTGKPVVLTVHEVWIGKWQEITGFSRMKCFFHDLLERCIYLLPFDRYICVSEATKRDVLARGISKRKVRRIYNGLDYEFWDPKKVSKQEIRKRREELELKDTFVCYAWGRPGESKGFEYLIRAAPQIVREIPEAKLLFMFGSTHQYKQKYRQLLQLIKKQQLPDNLKVLPPASKEQNRILIALADCIVVPSVSEGFGYNAVEATAMGKPVIVSDAGSLPEVVSGKHHLFKSKNNRELAEKIIRTWRNDLQHTEQKKFSWEACVRGYLMAYQEARAP